MPYSEPLIKEIAGLLDECGGNDRAMPATTLYNENWLLRLVLDWHKRNECPDSPFSFDPDATWYSEGLLASPFLKQPEGKEKKVKEGYTNSDGFVGHFSVSLGEKAKIVPDKNAKQLVVVEAKLGSGLSKGIANAPNYDQAARNACCLAHIARKSGIVLEDCSKFALYVVVPDDVKKGTDQKGKNFCSWVTDESIEGKVKERACSYGKPQEWHGNKFMPYFKKMKVELITWEDVLGKMKSAECGNEYQMFYDRCVEFDSRLNKKTKNK